jgi:hypothetical protein
MTKRWRSNQRISADIQANDDTDAPDPTEINIEAHFSVVDAFDMPAVHFDSIRGGFTTSVN